VTSDRWSDCSGNWRFRIFNPSGEFRRLHYWRYDFRCYSHCFPVV